MSAAPPPGDLAGYTPGQWVTLALPERTYGNYTAAAWWQALYHYDPSAVLCLGQIVKVGRARVQIRVVDADRPYGPWGSYTQPITRWFAPHRIQQVVSAPLTEEDEAAQARWAAAAEAAVNRQAAQALLDLRPVFLDTETTGLDSADQVVEVAIVDTDGAVLFHSLIRPTVPIDPQASRVHGLTEADLAAAPAFPEVLPALSAAIAGRPIIVYNADFDQRLLVQTCWAHGLGGSALPACQWHCLMHFYAAIWGDWSEYWGSYKWQSLSAAMCQQSVAWPADAHRALADAEAARRLLHVLAGSGEAYRLPTTPDTAAAPS